MKNFQLFRNILMVFWFGWAAMAGILITWLLTWLIPGMPDFGVMLAGSVIGIIAGGFAVLMIYVMMDRNQGSGFTRKDRLAMWQDED